MTIEIQPIACNKYQDPYLGKQVVKILPGEFYVSEAQEIIVTTLGSCIAACIRDTNTGIGGMNHFMLPQSKTGKWANSTDSATRYGNYAMEHLINEILKTGALKENLEAKLFGGGDMIDGGVIDIGNDNIAFAKTYLNTEAIKIIESDVGGAFSRKIYYTPEDGKVLMKRLKVLKNDTIQQRELAYQETLARTKLESDVEIF